MYKHEYKYEYYPEWKRNFYLKGKKNRVVKFHRSDKKCNFFGTLLCTDVNIIPNKNKIFIGKDIAFQMIQHADRPLNKWKEILV